MTARLLVGDVRDVLSSIAANSIDACVTDPPYGLEFMGKEWDAPWQNKGAVIVDPAKERGGFQDGNGGNPYSRSRIEYGRGNRGESKALQAWHETWAREVYRVLKPGAHLLAFGGTRTHHRLMCAIEDAGFEIRDCLMFVFGSGFPKSLDVSKALDKAAGVEREVVGTYEHPDGKQRHWDEHTTKRNGIYSDIKTDDAPNNRGITAPATDLARQWDGWGTALKPAYEPIILARKPLIGSVAANVTQYGTGGLNIDGCRIGTTRDVPASHSKTPNQIYGVLPPEGRNPNELNPELGRWPANLILDAESAALLDEVSGERTSPGNYQRSAEVGNAIYGKGMGNRNIGDMQIGYGDSGGASRYFFIAKPDSESRLFYTAKASRAERNKGLGSTYTVKYNVANEGGTTLCEATVALLQKVTSDIPTVKWRIGEFGGNITALCPPDSLSTTLTAINKIIASKTLPWLTPSPTNGFTADVNSVTANGGSPVESAANLSRSQQSITSDEAALARGAERVASQMLFKTSAAAEWKPDTNFHATVKPVDLMQWLVRLVTPPGGTVLDCFCGSGTTGIAADREGFDSILIDREPEYIEIARRRIIGDCPMFAEVVTP